MSGVQLDIESTDVIRLIQQYLKENNLLATHSALVAETGIALNTVQSIDQIVSDIKKGKWDAVLIQMQSMSLPKVKVMALYEQIVLELIEQRDLELAKEILRSTDPMSYLKEENLDRYMKLENLIRLPYFREEEAYDGSSRDSRRLDIAEAIASEVSVVPSYRLMTLLGQAIKYQSSTGKLVHEGKYDLFRGDKKASTRDVEDRIVSRSAGEMHFTAESHPESICFSPDGISLVTGSADGLIEVWDYDSCSLRLDLEYQAKEELMILEEAVICCCFNTNGDMLSTASRAGKLKVWKVSTGECVKKFPQAHSQGITSVQFSPDNTQLLTTSLDGTARVHGLKSGRTIKELRGHGSFVNCATYTRDGSSVITGSSDGTCKVWDLRSSDCIHTYRPGSSSGALRDNTILQLHNLPGDLLIITIKGSSAYLVHAKTGQLVRTFSSGKENNGDFLCSAVSPQGKWLYCGAEDGRLCIFDVSSSSLENALEVTDKQIVGISHHPFRNVVGLITDKGKLTIWKP